MDSPHVLVHIVTRVNIRGGAVASTAATNSVILLRRFLISMQDVFVIIM